MIRWAWSPTPSTEVAGEYLYVDPWSRQHRGLVLVLSLSAALHAAGFAALVIRSRDQRAILAPDDTIMVARLVRLGTPRDKDLLPRIPTATPRPKDAVNLPPPMEDPQNPALLTVPDREQRLKELEDRMARAFDRLERTGKGRVGARNTPAPGDPQGDPDGNSETAGEGERYLFLVQRQIERAWEIPTIIPERELLYLRATVVIYIGRDGRLVRSEVEKESGNRFFDSSLSQAIMRASPLPTPPDRLAGVFSRTGLEIRFRARR